MKKISGTNMAFPPPIKDRQFVRYWDRLVHIVSTKEGFDETCLKNLEILCSMYVEYDKLTEIIKENGYIFDAGEGRNGRQIKVFPPVTTREKLLGEIRHFSKALGIKVSSKAIVEDPDEEDWK